MIYRVFMFINSRMIRHFTQRKVSNTISRCITQLVVRSEDEMKTVANTLAPHAVSGDTFFLNGDVGIGKSVFARAFIRARTGEIDLEVPSPTYNFIISYDCPDSTNIHHIDLYRTRPGIDLLTELDLPFYMSDGVCLMEWPDRLPIEYRTAISITGLNIDITDNVSEPSEHRYITFKDKSQDQKWKLLLSELQATLSP